MRWGGSNQQTRLCPTRQTLEELEAERRGRGGGSGHLSEGVCGGSEPGSLGLAGLLAQGTTAGKAPRWRLGDLEGQKVQVWGLREQRRALTTLHPKGTRM